MQQVRYAHLLKQAAAVVAGAAVHPEANPAADTEVARPARTEADREGVTSS